MEQRNYNVVLTGTSDLLMHQDNLLFDELVKKWLKDPANKKKSDAGDDRTPAWKWLGYAYQHDGLLCIPSDNLMTMLREGGAKMLTGKKQETFKRFTQSGLMVNELGWPVEVDGAVIPWAPFEALAENQDYALHEKTARQYGFDLFAKRAKVGTAKHVRVRPRFAGWVARGSISVFEDIITTEVLEGLLKAAGAYCGIGDWRPSSPKSPGSFGRFTAEVTPA